MLQDLCRGQCPPTGKREGRGGEEGEGREEERERKKMRR